MGFNRNDIKKLANDDTHAFKSLYNIFYPKIHRFALMLLKNTQDADDVCQIIFMKIWLKRESLIEVHDLDNYLFVLSKNTILGYLSSEKMKYHGSDNIPDEKDTITPHEDLVVSDMQLLIDIVVDNMPEQRQIIYRMSREQHLKNDEIAKRLGIQKKTVENHLNLALKDVKKALYLMLVPILLWV